MTRKRCRVGMLPPILLDGKAVDPRRAVIRPVRRLGQCDKSLAMAPIYSHARELRTIGQQLDKQSIDIFDLRYEEGDYILECADPNPPFTDMIICDIPPSNSDPWSSPQPRHAAPDSISLISKAWRKSCGRSAENRESLTRSCSALATPDAGSDGTRIKSNIKPAMAVIMLEEIATNEIAELAMRMYKERARIRSSREPRSETLIEPPNS